MNEVDPKAVALCSFCHRQRSETKHMVENPENGVSICDRCVLRAKQALKKQGKVVPL